jgi:hypothetical protein
MICSLGFTAAWAQTAAAPVRGTRRHLLLRHVDAIPAEGHGAAIEHRRRLPAVPVAITVGSTSSPANGATMWVRQRGGKFHDRVWYDFQAHRLYTGT